MIEPASFLVAAEGPFNIHEDGPWGVVVEGTLRFFLLYFRFYFIEIRIAVGIDELVKSRIKISVCKKSLRIVPQEVSSLKSAVISELQNSENEQRQNGKC